jgi:phosphatidylserine decarboxylase
MTIHREGYPTIAWSAIILGVINLLSFYLLSFDYPAVTALIAIVTFGLFVFLISFFRVPKRTHTVKENAIIAPADGTGDPGSARRHGGDQSDLA